MRRRPNPARSRYPTCAPIATPRPTAARTPAASWPGRRRGSRTPRWRWSPRTAARRRRRAASAPKPSPRSLLRSMPPPGTSRHRDRRPGRFRASGCSPCRPAAWPSSPRPRNLRYRNLAGAHEDRSPPSADRSRQAPDARLAARVRHRCRVRLRHRALLARRDPARLVAVPELPDLQHHRVRPVRDQRPVPPAGLVGARLQDHATARPFDDLRVHRRDVHAVLCPAASDAARDDDPVDRVGRRDPRRRPEDVTRTADAGCPPRCTWRWAGSPSRYCRTSCTAAGSRRWFCSPAAGPRTRSARSSTRCAGRIRGRPCSAITSSSTPARWWPPSATTSRSTSPCTPRPRRGQRPGHLRGDAERVGGARRRLDRAVAERSERGGEGRRRGQRPGHLRGGR